MKKRLFCALASMVLLLSSAWTAAFAAEADTANPLLMDWSKPAYSYTTKGKKSAEKGYNTILRIKPYHL